MQRAADLLGGRERLAKALLVSMAEIDNWIADQARPPREMLLRVVDILLDESGPAGEASDAREPLPRDCADDASSRSLD